LIWSFCNFVTMAAANSLGSYQKLWCILSYFELPSVCSLPCSLLPPLYGSFHELYDYHPPLTMLPPFLLTPTCWMTKVSMLSCSWCDKIGLPYIFQCLAEPLMLQLSDFLCLCHKLSQMLIMLKIPSLFFTSVHCP